MKRSFPYGLGWQPDLPDHRDKSFQNATAHARAALGAPPDVLPSPSVHRVVTYQAWQAAYSRSNAMQQELRSGSGVLSRRYRAALDLAFGDDEGNPVKDSQGGGTQPKKALRKGGHSGRPVLLPAPPIPECLPKRVDLRPFMSPIEDQEQLGSCTAHAVVGLAEYFQIATGGAYVEGSRLFLYKATRDLLEWVGDRGAYIRETIKALRLFGICPERFLPYDTAKFDEEPSAFCYAFAGNYKAISYYRLNRLIEIKQSLAQGYPVALGFTCFESLALPQVQKTGVIPYPVSSERSVGGHAILAVGYIDDDQGNPEEPGHLIIRNSWGENWGVKGYGFLPYSYIQDNGTDRPPMSEDYWTMTAMDIPNLSESQAAPFALADSGNPVK